MSFDTLLNNLLDKVDGAQAACLIASDGIGIAEVNRNKKSLDISTLSIEYVTNFNTLKRLVHTTHLGNLEDIVLKTDQWKLVFRTLGDEYYIMLVVDEAGNLSKGRFLMRELADHIQQEL